MANFASDRLIRNAADNVLRQTPQGPVLRLFANRDFGLPASVENLELTGHALSGADNAEQEVVVQAAAQSDQTNQITGAAWPRAVRALTGFAS